MLQVSAAHRRVLMGDDIRGIPLVDLTTFSGTRKLSLSDYEYSGYMPTTGVGVIQTYPSRELGSGRIALRAEIAKKGWFVDSADNIRVADARIQYGFSLYDPENEEFLSRLILFTGVGDVDGENIFDDSLVSLSFKDVWGQVRQLNPWYLSRAYQRALDPTDGSMDDIAAQRPIGGRA